ncbi:FAS-associated factor 2-like [Orbicella faveolata]|uniref:FAS-associated factor 2-like n=1 Tax=Orbicella faveolata TaxID=48498 RepID=UPI0009E52497|nr:FAS-associated factor 2-like [Orbicella faveolata]
MAEGCDDSACRTEILAHFQDITGYNDIEECRAVLERHNWDIETAVQDTLNEAEGSEPVFHPRQDSFDGSDDENDGRDEDSATQSQFSRTTANTGTPRTVVVAQRQNQGWLFWALAIPFLPFRFASSIVRDLLGFIVRFIWPTAFQAQTTPLEDVLQFKAEFEAEYGAVHPTFYQGSYSQVRTK